MPYFKIITLGCKVNQYESAYLNEKLLNNRWHRAKKNEKADLVIINTCIVTQKASHQSRQEIRRAIRENPEAVVVVTGCYAQVYPEELTNIKGIDLIIGNKGKENIPEIIKKFNYKKILHVKKFNKKEIFALMPVSQFMERSRAFLKIQDGCESFCSYCIVPYARGPYRSMNINDVLNSIENLIDKGYKEIVLTGIHLGKYGVDQGISLETLLKEIGKQKYKARIRLSSIEPNEISNELLDMIACEDWICNHLHIPLQSGDNNILKRMNRKYRREDFYTLIMRIYEQIPFIAIGTDVMVGFPGEDSSAYENTLALIKELPISYLHVFPYSDRPATAAFSFKEKISPDIVKKRAFEVRELGKIKKKEFLERCMGKTFTAIVETKKGNKLLKGITDNYINVVFSCDRFLNINEPVRVKIENIMDDNSVLGRIVDG